MSAPSFLRVFDRSNGVTRVAMSDEAAIDASLARYLDRGCDEWLDLTSAEGGRVRMLTSTITSTMPSTPATRAAGRALDKTLEREGKGRKVRK